MRQIIKTFAPQECAWCKGSGKRNVSPGNIASCVVCGGKGSVAIAQPAAPCSYCEGSGSRNTVSKCLTCAGTGWEYVPPASPENTIKIESQGN